MNTEDNSWAKAWAQKATKEQIADLAVEWNTLKQALCADALQIPTGTENYIERSIAKAKGLYKYRDGFRQLIRLLKQQQLISPKEFSERILRIKLSTYGHVCENCFGAKTIGPENHPCIICGGSGINPKYQELLDELEK